MKSKISAFMMLTAALLTGCGDTGAGGKINNTNSAVNMGLERLGERNSVRAGGAQFSDGIFVGASPERNNSASMLPANLQVPGAITLNSKSPMTLADIAKRLSETTGIPHILALGPTGSDSGTLSTEDSTQVPAPAQAEGNRSARRQAAAAAPASDTKAIRVNLRGSMSDVLTKVATGMDVEWSYSDGRVIFRDYVTRKYQVTALPTTNSASTGIGSNNITSSSSMSSDVWGEVRDTLNGLVGDGAKVAIGSTTGLVTVTAKVGDQNRVKEYVDQLNGSLSQQIGFDVYVLTVTLSDSASYGVDLGAALARGTGGAAQFGAAPFSSSSDMGSYNIGLISGDVSVGAVANALSTQGQVAVSTRAGTTIANNRVAPIEVVDEYAYLAEVTIEENDDGDDRIVRTPDTVTTGFQMQLFPRIMNNRDIMVQYTVRLSELNEIKTFGEGNEAVQLPEVSTTSFEQQAVLANGQTLVIAGFERERVTTENSKRFGLTNGAGKSKAEETSRVGTVIMITPRIINRSK